MRVVIVVLLALLNVSFLMWQFYRPRQLAPHWAATDPGVPLLQIAPPDPPPVRDASASPPRDDATATTTGAAATRAAPPDHRAINDARVPAADPQAVTTATDKLQCPALGPISSQADAATLQSRFLGLNFHPTIEQGRQSPRRYRVLLLDQADRSAALQRITALKQKGVHDIQLLSGNADDSRISLGVFRDRATAERRVNQIAALGYAPQLDARPHAERSYWLVFAPASRARLAQAQNAETEALQFEVPMTERPCTTVAKSAR